VAVATVVAEEASAEAAHQGTGEIVSREMYHLEYRLRPAELISANWLTIPPFWLYQFVGSPDTLYSTLLP
jgi:hypothetical protein